MNMKERIAKTAAQHEDHRFGKNAMNAISFVQSLSQSGPAPSARNSFKM